MSKKSRLLLPLVIAVTSAAACGSSSPATSDAAVGGPVVGELDMHCTGVSPIIVDPASCNIAPAPGAVEEEDGDPMYNAEGDDDDCKYHLKFTATPAAIKVGQPVSFTVTVTYKADLRPATGAVTPNGVGIYIESFLANDETHVLPNPVPVFAEKPAGSGVYTATAKFDASGRWVVRFHLFGNCLDGAEDSPHAHAAFFFDVP